MCLLSQMTTVQFLDYFKQKSFSTRIPLFWVFLFVNLDDTFLCGLAYAVHNTQHTSSGIPIAVECLLEISPCRYPFLICLSLQHISIYVLIISSLQSFPTPSLCYHTFFSLWLHQYSLNEIEIFKILPVIRKEVEKFHQFSSTISSSFLNRGECSSFM